MWFDPHARLAEIERPTPATPAAIATRRPDAPPRVAVVANVAAPPRSQPEIAPPPPDGPDPDALALLDWLARNGAATYGRAARGLHWGVERAAKAEWRLRKARRVTFDQLGRATPADAR